MREFLCRGKKVRGGEWLYGVPARGKIDDLTPEITLMISLAGFDARYHLIPDIEGDWVIPETVGWFTGWRDVNNRIAFDGDIIRVGERVLVIFWNDEDFQWQAKTPNSTPYKPFDLHLKNDEWDHIDLGWFVAEPAVLGKTSVEIIGNIHDNPELVKEETKWPGI